MSVRPLAGACAAAAVLLAAPVAAQARPADPPGSSRVATEVPAAPASYEATTVVHDGGVATLTVLAIAGGALLAGAASGFEGGRVAARRSAARP